MSKIKKRTLRIRRPRRTIKKQKKGLKKYNRRRKRKQTKKFTLRKKRKTIRRKRKRRVKNKMKGGNFQVPILSDLFAMTSNNTGNFFNTLKGNHTITSSLPNAQALPRYVKNPPLFS